MKGFCADLFEGLFSISGTARFRIATLTLFLALQPDSTAAEADDVSLEIQLIRVPAGMALEMIFTRDEAMSSGDALFTRATGLIAEKRAELLDRRTLIGKAALRIRETESKAHVFATEYDIEGEGRRATLLGEGQESRDIGTTVNASVTPSENGSLKVTLEYERHLSPPTEKPVSYPDNKRLHELKASQPEFRFHVLSSSFTAFPGTTTLVAAVTPVGIDNPEKVTSIDLLFVKADGATSGEKKELTNSDIGMLVISVPDTLGSKVEAQNKPAPELLAQLVEAVQGGKASLEAATYNHRGLDGQCDDPVRSVLECRLPKAIDFKKAAPFPVPEAIEPFQLGIITGAYVERGKDGTKVPWRLQLDLERLKPARKPDATAITYEGTNLQIEGEESLVGDSFTELIDVSTTSVGEPRRYFSFLRVMVR